MVTVFIVAVIVPSAEQSTLYYHSTVDTHEAVTSPLVGPQAQGFPAVGFSA